MILEKQLRRFARRCWVTTRRHPLLPFMLAATLASDAVLLIRKVDFQESIELLFSCQIYVLLSQCSLMGIWLVHRLKGFSVRLLIVTLSLTAFYTLFFIRHFSHLGEDDDLPLVLVTFVFLSAIIALLPVAFLFRKNLTIPKYNVRSLLLLSTAIGITCGVLRQINFSRPMPWSFFLFAVCTVIIWKISHRTNGWYRNVILLILWPMQLLALIDYSILFGSGEIVFIANRNEFQDFLLIISCMHLFTLIWSFGLQYQSRPMRRKREQAALALPEQPVRLHNQDVDQLDSLKSTEPDNEASGPIDLRV